MVVKVVLLLTHATGLTDGVGTRSGHLVVGNRSFRRGENENAVKKIRKKRHLADLGCEAVSSEDLDLLDRLMVEEEFEDEVSDGALGTTVGGAVVL